MLARRRGQQLLLPAALACALLSAPTASANTLLPSSISLPIQVPSTGNSADGTSSLAVTFTDTQATAPPLSTPTGLAVGPIFHAVTCIKAPQLATPGSSLKPKGPRTPAVRPRN